MKKYIFAIVTLFPLAALAHGMEVEEESGIGHQMEELGPFAHMGEGHYYAAIVSAILWASLVYTVYSLVVRMKKPAGQ